MNDDGRALSSMGAAFSDIDNDGREDVFITALANETFPLYRNEGKGAFADVTYRSHIGAASLAQSGWSTGIYDFDNDGWKDIFAACGDVNDNTELFSSRKSRAPTCCSGTWVTAPFRQRKSARPRCTGERPSGISTATGESTW
jgi:hypothetical protein